MFSSQEYLCIHKLKFYLNRKTKVLTRQSVRWMFSFNFAVRKGMYCLTKRCYNLVIKFKMENRINSQSLL